MPSAFVIPDAELDPHERKHRRHVHVAGYGLSNVPNNSLNGKGARSIRHRR
jgi:hypothetical protein